jgi:hypothetical protein
VIFTEADDLEALREQVRDAVAVHFEPGSGPAVIRTVRSDGAPSC